MKEKGITLVEIKKLIGSSEESYSKCLQEIVDKVQRSATGTPAFINHSIDEIDFEIFPHGVIHPFGEVGYLITDAGGNLNLPNIVIPFLAMSPPQSETRRFAILKSISAFGYKLVREVRNPFSI